MRRIFAIVMVSAALFGCSPYSQSDRTVGGGLIGAGTGAAIGGLATRSVGGALVGAAAGGVAGALIGRATTPNSCWYRDRYGRRYLGPCP